MFIHKLSACLLITGMFFQIPVYSALDKTENFQNGETSLELKQNAFELLQSVMSEASKFKLTENRVQARIIAADLMWKQDESAARSSYKQAFAELQKLFAQADAGQSQKAVEDDQSANRFRLVELRREYVLTLAAHDSQLAIDALGLLKAKKIESWDPLAEDATELKLKTAIVIAERDPNHAHALYAEEIAASGVTLPLLESLRDLQKNNSELTAKVAVNVFNFIKSAKIVDMTDDRLTEKSARKDPSELNFWQVGAFLNAVAKLKRSDAKNPPLSDEQTKQLAEILAQAFLNAPHPAKHSINQAMTNITIYAPEQAKLIRQKVGAEGVKAIEGVMDSDAYYLAIEEKTADELARLAEAEEDKFKRDSLYSEAARKALETGDAEKAQVIDKRIKDRENYFALVKRIENEVPFAVARSGDEAKTRKILPVLKTGYERQMVLVELASAFAAKGEKEKAKKLLDETMDILFTAKPNSKSVASDESDNSGIESVMEFAGKFAAVSVLVDPDETFYNLEPIIYAVNKEVKRLNPSGKHAEELTYAVMEQKFLLNISNSTELLRNLGRADFERTLKLIDKLERPEIRLFARLRLVQALLDPQADAKANEKRERFLTKMDES